jgi:hypothetical protein
MRFSANLFLLELFDGKGKRQSGVTLWQGNVVPIIQRKAMSIISLATAQ